MCVYLLCLYSTWCVCRDSLYVLFACMYVCTCMYLCMYVLYIPWLLRETLLRQLFQQLLGPAEDDARMTRTMLAGGKRVQKKYQPTALSSASYLHATMDQLFLQR